MKTKTTIIIATLICLITIPAELFAQNYKTGLGGRLGYPFGLTVKHFISEPSAIEVLVGARKRGGEVVGLYEYHIYPAKRKEFALYFGGGAHVGVYDDHHPYWDAKHHHDKDKGHAHDPYLGVGLDGIIGASWSFSEAPVNVGFDYKPAFSFYRYTGFAYGDAAISVRYLFGHKHRGAD